MSNQALQVGFAVAIASLALSACSKGNDPNEYAKLIRGQTEFSSAISISYGPDSSSVYLDVISRRSITSAMSAMCKAAYGIHGQMQNYTGELKAAWKQDGTPLDGPSALVWDWGATDFQVLNWNQGGNAHRSVCPTYNTTFWKHVNEMTAAASAKGAQILRTSGTPTTMIELSSGATSFDNTMVPLAYRTNPSITYMKEYKTDVPMKGNSVIRSATCEYDVVVLNKQLRSTGRGTCNGKWLLDNDTGKWTTESFELHDPDILIDWHVPDNAAKHPGVPNPH